MTRISNTCIHSNFTVQPDPQQPATAPVTAAAAASSVSIDDSLNCIDNLSVIEEAHQRNSIASSARTVIIKDDPPSAAAATASNSAAAASSHPPVLTHKPPLLPAAIGVHPVRRKPVALPRFSTGMFFFHQKIYKVSFTSFVSPKLFTFFGWVKNCRFFCVITKWISSPN